MRLPADALQKKENWNGYNAGPTSPKAVAAAEDLTTWFPMAHGGMMLEATIGDSEVTIEIDADGKLDAVFWGKTSSGKA